MASWDISYSQVLLVICDCFAYIVAPLQLG